MIDEGCVRTLPSPAPSAPAGLEMSLHRGSCETVLTDEDNKQVSDRWDSHTFIPTFSTD